MGSITELQLRDVRCFEGEQSARLSRITLLVGENSAGKSTFLGCYKTLTKLANLNDLGDDNHFDEAPFHMGPFDTIVRSGKTDFALGGRFKDHCHTGIEFTFIAAEENRPVEQQVRLEFNGTGDANGHLDITWLREPRDILRFEAANLRFDLDRSELSFDSISTWLSRYVRRGYLPFRGDPTEFRRHGHPSNEEEVEFAKFLSLMRATLPWPNKLSFIVKALDPALPARQRVYPSLPDHLGDDRRDSDLMIILGTIGKKLGLWEAISIRDRPDDRGTEVLIKTPSGWYNLIDVGYGVHSLLPLVRAIYRSPVETVFLLQQPEIHLHPRAQAALAQFMVESGHGFVVETHSEHFMDRFRICVLEHLLRPEELAVVYFEPTPDGKSSRIHSMAVDEQANFLDVPESYRSFFLQETERLLGFRD